MSLLLDALKNAEQAKARSEQQPKPDPAATALDFEITDTAELTEPQILTTESDTPAADPSELLNHASLELEQVEEAPQTETDEATQPASPAETGVTDTGGLSVQSSPAEIRNTRDPHETDETSTNQTLYTAKAAPKLTSDSGRPPAPVDSASPSDEKPAGPDSVEGNTPEQPSAPAAEEIESAANAGVNPAAEPEPQLAPPPAPASMNRAKGIVNAPRPSVREWNPWLIGPAVLIVCGIGLYVFHITTRVEPAPAFAPPDSAGRTAPAELPAVDVAASGESPVPAGPNDAHPTPAAEPAARPVPTRGAVSTRPQTSHTSTTPAAPRALAIRRPPPEHSEPAATSVVPAVPTNPGASIEIVNEPNIRIQRTQTPTSLRKWLKLGYRNLMESDHETAAVYYRKVLEIAPDNSDALLGLGEIARITGDNSAAKHYFEEALQRDPSNLYAKSVLTRIGRPDSSLDSESDLKILISENPGTAILHFNLANLYAGQSRWVEAQEAYTTAFQLDSSRADYAFNLAVSMDQQGDLLTAVHFYRTALQLAGNSDSAFNRRAAVRRIEQILKPHRDQARES